MGRAAGDPFPVQQTEKRGLSNNTRPVSSSGNFAEILSGMPPMAEGESTGER